MLVSTQVTPSTDTSIAPLLCLGGLDPSGGAGLLADIKAAQALDVYALGVATAITAQTHNHFYSCTWLSCEQILSQCLPLIKLYQPRVIKWGIVESLSSLLYISSIIQENLKTPATFIWDPVLKPSASGVFHDSWPQDTLTQIQSCIHILTPNKSEAQALQLSAEFTNNTYCSVESTLTELFDSKSEGNHLSQNPSTGLDTPIPLHNLKEPGIILKGVFKGSQLGDLLLLPHLAPSFFPIKQMTADKHGTGCIFASSLASSLCKNNSLSSLKLALDQAQKATAAYRSASSPLTLPYPFNLSGAL